MVRLKHRYLLVNILYPEVDTAANTTKLKATEDVPYPVQFHQPTSDRVDARSLTQMIRNGVAELFGDYGSGMTGPSLQVKYFSPATSTAIIRVSRDHYRLVWAALAFALELPKPVSQKCAFQVVRVSGTIRKAEEEAIRRAQASIRRAQRPLEAVSRDDMISSSAGLPDVDMESDFANGIDDSSGSGEEDGSEQG